MPDISSIDFTTTGAIKCRLQLKKKLLDALNARFQDYDLDTESKCIIVRIFFSSIDGVVGKVRTVSYIHHSTMFRHHLIHSAPEWNQLLRLHELGRCNRYLWLNLEKSRKSHS